MKKINIAICDDEQLHLQTAKTLINQIMEEKGKDFKIFSFNCPQALLESGFLFDIAVLDIEYEKENCIDLAKSLNRFMPQCRIIFLSSYLHYAADVYEADHIWFVLKQDSQTKLPKAIDKAVRSIETELSQHYIFVRKQSTVTRIPINTILYITKIDRQAEVHCLDKDYFDYRKPNDLVPAVLQERFFRCHQGFIVNLSMIKELDKDEFVLINDERVPISRKYKEEARVRFFQRYSIN